jgi:transposase-like protein
MKTTRDGRRRFSREFKIAAVRRVFEGEAVRDVAHDLGVKFGVLWQWKKRAVELGEDHLYELGRPQQWGRAGPNPSEASQERRIAELERLVGRQEMEIRFLDKALHRVEERRQQKNAAGGRASSKR